MDRSTRTGVFISHAHEDRDLAQALSLLLKTALELDASNITCTSDADYGLERGADLREQITRRLGSARGLFLLATPSSHTRDWVQYECAIADAAREQGLEFHIVTPLSAHGETVPDPYVGRVAVTLSCGEELHAFVKQLRRTFGRGEETSASYVDPLLDLVDRASRIEAAHQRAAVAARLAKGDRHRKAAIALAVCAGVFAIAGGAAMWWAATRQAAHAAFVTELNTQHAKELDAKDDMLSAQLRDAEIAANEEFKQFPFAGLFQDSRLRNVRCSQVEVFVPDISVEKGERQVQKSCDGRGAFIFSGPELQVDARVPIRLRVHVGGSRPYEFLVSRTSSSWPLLFREGQ
jgi:hypothetical protein